MMNKFFLYPLILVNIIFQVCYSQEYTYFPAINPILSNDSKKVISLKSVNSENDTVELPFFDDFAEPGIYPNDGLWLNNEVYINYTFAINPPTIGVATFDCYNYKGEIHDFKDNASFIRFFVFIFLP